MYQNTVATPRLDLAGPIRAEDESLDAYIAHQVLPPFPVDQRNGNVPTQLVTDDQIIDIKHAPKTAYQRVQATLGNATFACEEAGIEEPISAEDYAVLGQDRAEQLAASRAKDIILRQREAALAGAVTGAAGETLFSGQVTSAAATWDNASGTPIDDVGTADEALGLRIGEGLRWLVIGRGVLTKLQKNAQIRTEYRRIVGQTKAEATYRKIELDILAQILGVDRILLGSGRKNTANAGQTAVKAFIWPSTYALLLRGVQNPGDLMEPALGRMFMWDQANLGAEAEVEQVDALFGLSIESYRDEAIKADVIRGTEYTHLKVLNSKSAQLIKSI